MFDSLSDKLHAVFKKLRGESRLSESNIAEAMREIRLALLEADVNIEIATAFIEKVKNDCVEWIKDFFDKNGKGCNAVVGISGGKDSSIVAALCVEALGKERVIGVLMPCGVQADIDCAKQLVEHLGIKNYTINVKDAIDGLLKSMPEGLELSPQTKTNLPPRIRMATLYAVAQSENGRVANTCNLLPSGTDRISAAESAK